MERKVEFKSEGVTVRGVLRLPDNPPGKVPLQVMAGGWCYTKEIVMPYYGEHFLKKGVGILMIDYRNFGDSDGDRRQHLDPWMQIEDYRSGVSYAESLTEVDANRIGIWGISYSGGHVLIAGATDPRVKWLIGTVPVVDGYRTMRRTHGESRFHDLKAAIIADRRKRFETGGYGDTLPMSSKTPDTELSSWPFSDVYEIFNDIKSREAPNHEHWNSIESVELLLAYDVSAYCRKLYDLPVLMSIAQGDDHTSGDLEIEAFNLIPSPNKTLDIAKGITHMSLYNNPDNLNKVAAVQADWLARQLSDM